MSRFTRKYEVEIITTSIAQQVKVDLALEALAAEGIWVHSNRERDTRTGKPLTAHPALTTLYAAGREV